MTDLTGKNLRDMMIEACAAAAHEANRVWCRAHVDHSQVAWNDAPKCQQSSAVKGVEGVLAGNGPEQLHQSWLREKEATGWKYGPVKDAAKKEHPCFVPYSDLPPEQKAKDDIFIDTVRAVASALRLS